MQLSLFFSALSFPPFPCVASRGTHLILGKRNRLQDVRPQSFQVPKVRTRCSPVGCFSPGLKRSQALLESNWVCLKIGDSPKWHRFPLVPLEPHTKKGCPYFETHPNGVEIILVDLGAEQQEATWSLENGRGIRPCLISSFGIITI